MTNDALTNECSRLMMEANRILGEILFLIKNRRREEARKLRIFYQEQLCPRLLEITVEIRNKKI